MSIFRQNAIWGPPATQAASEYESIDRTVKLDVGRDDDMQVSTREFAREQRSVVLLNMHLCLGLRNESLKRPYTVIVAPETGLYDADSLAPSSLGRRWPLAGNDLSRF